MSDSTLSGTAVSVHIHVGTQTIGHHCTHDDGRISLVIRGDNDNLYTTPDVYLVGSEAELLDFAKRIRYGIISADGTQEQVA